MRSTGLDRLVVLSSPAVVDTADRPNLFYRAARVLLRAVMPAIVRDHRTQARLIEESGLTWTIIRGPLILTRLTNVLVDALGDDSEETAEMSQPGCVARDRDAVAGSGVVGRMVAQRGSRSAAQGRPRSTIRGHLEETR
jgi:hypothetical protein